MVRDMADKYQHYSCGREEPIGVLATRDAIALDDATLFSLLPDNGTIPGVSTLPIESMILSVGQMRPGGQHHLATNQTTVTGHPAVIVKGSCCGGWRYFCEVLTPRNTIFQALCIR